MLKTQTLMLAWTNLWKVQNLTRKAFHLQWVNK